MLWLKKLGVLWVPPVEKQVKNGHPKQDGHIAVLV
jgi:hypothetical protein